LQRRLTSLRDTPEFCQSSQACLVNFRCISTAVASAATVFADRCINGITATTAGPEAVERGLMMATALSPRIGYAAAAAIARHARETGRTIREVAREHTDLSEDTLTHLLDARRLAGP
jgi:fumarate hydratase, class II